MRRKYRYSAFAVAAIIPLAAALALADSEDSIASLKTQIADNKELISLFRQQKVENLSEAQEEISSFEKVQDVFASSGTDLRMTDAALSPEVAEMIGPPPAKIIPLGSALPPEVASGIGPPPATLKSTGTPGVLSLGGKTMKAFQVASPSGQGSGITFSGSAAQPGQGAGSGGGTSGGPAKGLVPLGPPSTSPQPNVQTQTQTQPQTPPSQKPSKPGSQYTGPDVSSGEVLAADRVIGQDYPVGQYATVYRGGDFIDNLMSMVYPGTDTLDGFGRGMVAFARSHLILQARGYNQDQIDEIIAILSARWKELGKNLETMERDQRGGEGGGGDSH